MAVFRTDQTLAGSICDLPKSHQPKLLNTQESLEGFLNTTILPKLKSVNSGSYRYFLGIEKFIVSFDREGTLVIKVKPKAHIVPGLNRDEKLASLYLSKVLSSLPESLREFFYKHQVLKDDNFKQDAELEARELQEKVSSILEAKLRSLNITPESIRYFRVSFASSDKDAVTPLSKDPKSRIRIDAGVGLKLQHIDTYTIVDIDIGNAAISAHAVHNLRNEMQSELDIFGDIFVRFIRLDLKQSALELIKQKSRLVMPEAWHSELTNPHRNANGNLRGVRRLARIRRGLLGEESRGWSSKKYDLQKIYDLRNLPFVAIDSKSIDIFGTKGRGAEDAFYFLELSQSVYQLSVFPLNKYPKEY
ncbi:MAG: hypothetical protein KDD56_05845, partial [Bdellovibrionales bacterium]|nr:hypothetical protein [Bdellovibrionales bacterium]